MNTTYEATTAPETEEYDTFSAIFLQFAKEIYEFFKYIFHDLWLGKAP